MAQIIKHRRGLIGGVKNLTARNGELIIASGSISDLAGPFVFIGSPNTVDEGVAGAFNSVSKLYTGTAAPTITAATYGSALDGTPYYASSDKSLYILNNSNVGNSQIDLTGNIEGNTISGVTINNLESTNVSASYFTGSFRGDGTGLYNVPASGVTGLELNQIGQGTVTASITEANGFSVNTNSAITGTLNVNGNTSVTGTFVATDGAAFINQGVISQNSNLLLTSGSNLVIQDGGNLQVAGNASISGALFVSGDIYQTGSYYTQGNIVLSGSINIGDNLTGDTINFGGEISSSIIPAVNNSFDLGSPTNAWNDIYVSGTAYIENINLAGISIDSISLPGNLTVSGTTILSGSVYVEDLIEKRLVVAGVDGLLTDYSGLTFDNGNLNVSGAIEVTDIQGTGSLYLKPNKNDSRLFEIYNTGNDDIHIKGNDLYSFFGDDTNYVKLDHDSNYVTVKSDNNLYLQSQNSHIYQESFDGSIYLNDNSGNNINIGGNTYVNNSKRIYVNNLWDNSDNSNYLQLYGWNTDDGYWWESGDGTDTTLLNNVNGANLNLLQTNSGNVNIDATQGSVNLHSANGFNVTGSLVVSDASGVFNSSLNVSNSDLTLDGGSDIHMNDGAHLFFDTCGDIYYDSGTGNVIFYNDCNNFEFRNNISITGSLNVSSGIYTDDIHGKTTYTNSLHLNGGVNGAPDVELHSINQISLYSEGSNGGSSYAINMTGSVYMMNDLNVTGSVSMLSTLNVNGATSVTGAFTVGSGSMTSLGGDLYVSGNLQVLGSSTNVNIQSQTVDIGDNIIQVNAYSPFDRYAGLAAYDSGSSGASGSFLWDSTNDYWLIVNANGNSSKVIGTTASTGSTGTEISLTSGTFPIASSTNTIGDSLLTFSGTTLAFNNNKFTVDSGTGATAISGNLTLSYSGGTDGGSKTSAVTFRNSSNVLGFVSTTETTNELDGILGYNHSSGVLEFSSLIDGGTY